LIEPSSILHLHKTLTLPSDPPYKLLLLSFMGLGNRFNLLQSMDLGQAATAALSIPVTCFAKLVTFKKYQLFEFIMIL
jgi:hypothetical protein